MLRHAIEDGLFLRTVNPPRPRGTLLWIHGLGESGLCFEGILAHPALAGFAHRVPDLPGYGRTAWPETPLSLERIADTLASWLRRRGDGPVAVVGHSMGGVLGVHLAERHPDLVAAFVNVEGNVSLGDCAYSGAAAGISEAEFEAGGFDALRDIVCRDGMDDPASRRYHASLQFAHPATFHRHSLELVATSQAEEQARRLAALPCPVRYVAGVPRGICLRSHALLDAAGVAVDRLQPSGHWPFVDQPDAFAAAVAGFLGR